MSTTFTFDSVAFESWLIGNEDGRLSPVRNHFNVPILARNVATPVDSVVEIASVVLNLGHGVPGDDQISRRRASAFDVVGILVGHVGRRGAHLRMVRWKRRANLVAGNNAERVIRPRAHFDFEPRFRGRHVLERNFPAVGCETRVKLDRVRQDWSSIIARRSPFDSCIAVIALDADHSGPVGNVCGQGNCGSSEASVAKQSKSINKSLPWTMSVALSSALSRIVLARQV